MFMRYVNAVLRDRAEAMAYRFYISDTLFYNAQRKGLKKQYRDIIRIVKIDRRSGDEIASDVIKRIGITITSEEVV